MSSQPQAPSSSAPSSAIDANSSNGPPITLDSLLAHITAVPAPPPAALAHTLRQCAPRDVRDIIFCCPTGTGVDPLVVLDAAAHTVGVLYILAARLSSSNVQPPPMAYIEAFCKSFDPVAARCAADRVTLVAQGILRLAEASNNMNYALQPLHDLLTRFAPPNTLTALHPLFVRVCLHTGRPALALPLLSAPLPPPLPPAPHARELLDTLHYTDHLVFHYAGGLALAACHRWAPAAAFLEAAAAAPGAGGAASALQLEALKKLILVQLAHVGRAPPPPKYTSPLLLRALQASPYGALAKACTASPVSHAYLASIVETERVLFEGERNLGLVKLAAGRASRWGVRALQGTYASIGLADAGRLVGLDEAGVVAAVLELVDAGEIDARIDGSVLTFAAASDAGRTRADVDRALREAETHAAALRRLEMEITRSREYLSKAVRNREEPGWGAGGEEDILFAPGERALGGGMGGFADDAMFA